MVEAAQSAGRGCEKRPNASRAALKCVVCNAELERRRPRAADFAGESHALASLVDALAGAGSHADGVLQQLAEAALDLCRAHSSASRARGGTAGARPRAGRASGSHAARVLLLLRDARKRNADASTPSGTSRGSTRRRLSSKS